MFKFETRALLLGLGLAGVIALGLAMFAGVRAFDRMKADAAAYADCQAIAGVSRRAPADPPRCAPAIAARLVIAAKATACDQALPKGEAGAFAVRQVCSAEVKRLVADRDARAGEVAQRDQLVDQLKAERSADVARAEARGLAQARRSANATRALDHAPRDDRGRRACDADCLSVLAGDSP